MEPTEKPKVNVPERLKGKEDGRKRAWWDKKIEQLETELEAYRNEGFTEACESSELDYTSYAQGFVDCMHKFQIMAKKGRAQVLVNLTKNGPAGLKKIKSMKFRGLTL